MKEILEAIQTYILPVVTLILTYYGWRATSEKNKLKAELKGLEASNTAKDIENQSSWLELYKQLHDDMAKRMVSMETEIQTLKKTIKLFENAFKKIHDCLFDGVCPVAAELQKYKATNRQRTNKRPKTNRQREPADTTEGNTGDGFDSYGENEPEC